MAQARTATSIMKVQAMDKWVWWKQHVRYDLIILNYVRIYIGMMRPCVIIVDHIGSFIWYRIIYTFIFIIAKSVWCFSSRHIWSNSIITDPSCQSSADRAPKRKHMRGLWRLLDLGPQEFHSQADCFPMKFLEIPRVFPWSILAAYKNLTTNRKWHRSHLRDALTCWWMGKQLLESQIHRASVLPSPRGSSLIQWLLVFRV